jgi:hypothetical protein
MDKLLHEKNSGPNRSFDPPAYGMDLHTDF